MRILLGLVLACTLVAGASATDFERGAKESELAIAYTKCGMYADISNLDVEKNLAIPEQDAKKFRLLALNHWRASNKLYGLVQSRDDEILDFAGFVSSVEAIQWDEHPELNKSQNDGVNPGTAVYQRANCGLLLQSAQ
ncbi:hypothetical protein AB6I73_003905 [Citrobacter amalonaticus]